MAKAKRRKQRRNVTVAVAHIRATFNNTTVTITDTKGDTLCWASAGTCGFKGSRKSTPFAGQVAAPQAAEKAAKFGVRDHRGGGRSSARETAARVIAGAIAKLLLKKFGVTINAFVSKVGQIVLQNFAAQS